MGNYDYEGPAPCESCVEWRETYKVLAEKCETVRGERDRAVEENEEINALLLNQRARVDVATKLWREANPGNDNVLPDLGKLVQWLMDEAANAKASRDQLATRCEELQAEGETLRKAVARAGDAIEHMPPAISPEEAAAFLDADQTAGNTGLFAKLEALRLSVPDEEWAKVSADLSKTKGRK